MKTVTAICQEAGYPDVLIYTVKVRDPDDYEEVRGAVQLEREQDVSEAGEMSVLFTFQGDIAPRSDFRM